MERTEEEVYFLRQERIELRGDSLASAASGGLGVQVGPGTLKESNQEMSVPEMDSPSD